MIGAGSLAHNRRDFVAENVDPDRVQLNICYKNENLKEVYKELFDDATERYNVGKRKDRQIANIMNNAIEGWKPHGTHRFGKEYGIQRSWKRMEDSVKKDKDGFMEVPEQLEIPFE